MTRYTITRVHRGRIVNRRQSRHKTIALILGRIWRKRGGVVSVTEWVRS